MKGKHLAILLLLVAVVGGASWLLLQRDQSSWTDKTPALGQKVLNLPLNDVAHIVVKAVEGDMNLVKKNDLWVVSERGDYPANFEQVSTLLRKVWDLKTVQVVKVGPSQLDRVGLVEPGKEGNSGILVDFLDKDGKRLDALLLGKAYTKKATGDLAALGDMPVGRYVRPVKENAPVSLVSENFEGVTPDIPRWLDHDFFKVTDPLSITLAGLTDAQHWKLTRENSTAEWTLADPKPGEELDKNKLFSITSTFTTPAFIDVVKLEATPAEVGLDKPTVVTLETAEHFVYTVKLGKLNTDYYPVAVTVTANLPKERTPGKGEKPEDKQKLDEAFQADQKRLQEKLAGEKKFESRVYLMQKSALDSILKDRSALMADKKTDAPAPGEAPFIPPPQAPITLPIPVPAPVVPPAPAPAAPAPAAPAPAPAPAPEAAPSAPAPAPAAPAPTSATTPPVQAPAPAADQPAEAK